MGKERRHSIDSHGLIIVCILTLVFGGVVLSGLRTHPITISGVRVTKGVDSQLNCKFTLDATPEVVGDTVRVVVEGATLLSPVTREVILENESVAVEITGIDYDPSLPGTRLKLVVVDRDGDPVSNEAVAGEGGTGEPGVKLISLTFLLASCLLAGAALSVVPSGWSRKPWLACTAMLLVFSVSEVQSIGSAVVNVEYARDLEFLSQTLDTKKVEGNSYVMTGTGDLVPLEGATYKKGESVECQFTSDSSGQYTWELLSLDDGTRRESGTCAMVVGENNFSVTVGRELPVGEYEVRVTCARREPFWRDSYNLLSGDFQVIKSVATLEGLDVRSVGMRGTALLLSGACVQSVLLVALWTNLVYPTMSTRYPFLLAGLLFFFTLTLSSGYRVKGSPGPGVAALAAVLVVTVFVF
ncbi:MAG: hypothetical protein ACTSU5_12380 [Promethearchaeota archaeon]